MARIEQHSSPQPSPVRLLDNFQISRLLSPNRRWQTGSDYFRVADHSGGDAIYKHKRVSEDLSRVAYEKMRASIRVIALTTYAVSSLGKAEEPDERPHAFFLAAGRKSLGS